MVTENKIVLLVVKLSLQVDDCDLHNPHISCLHHPCDRMEASKPSGQKFLTAV